MIRIFVISIIAILTCGCVAPSFTGQDSIPQETYENTAFVVVKNPKVKEGFLIAIEDWLKDNKIDYEVQVDSTLHDHSKVTIEYIGYWNWDMAVYLSSARIEAFHEGQRIGEVDYRAPNTLHTNKFSDARERVFHMMDILFGKISAYEATKLINKSTKSERATRRTGGY